MPTYHLVATVTISVDINADSPQAAYQVLRDGGGVGPDAHLITIDELEMVLDEGNNDITHEVQHG